MKKHVVKIPTIKGLVLDVDTWKKRIIRYTKTILIVVNLNERCNFYIARKLILFCTHQKLSIKRIGMKLSQWKTSLCHELVKFMMMKAQTLISFLIAANIEYMRRFNALYIAL